MKYISISQLSNYKDQSVELKGWVYNTRSMGSIAFLILRDGSGMVQCVIRKNTPCVWERFQSLKQEDCVIVEGQVKEHKGFEIHTHSLIKWKTFSVPKKDALEKSTVYPLGKKDHGVNFLLSHRHLWLRSKKPWAILKIRNEITQAIHSFFKNLAFVQIDAPVLTPTACEGTADLFSVRFFEESSMFLSQSGQLYMEAACAAFGKVYCLNPVFRAEKSSTRRHLLEFWMLEPEIAFCDLNGCMQIAEDLIVYIVKQVLKNRQAELKMLDRDIQKLENIKAPFPKISYKEALELLVKHKKIPHTNFNKGFGAEEETFLSSFYQKPVFVHHYPLVAKAFYMKTDSEDPLSSLSFDLLGTEACGELIGGSEREDDLTILEQKIKDHNLQTKHLEWYKDLRKYGSFPHSGFGLGIERLLGWICGLHHVRESIAFPRLYGRDFI